MKRVHLRTETGNLIHFQHPHKLGYVLFCLSLCLLIASLMMPPVVSHAEVWAMAAFLGTFGLVFWAYRLDVQFFPNHREFLVRQGIWPNLKVYEGPYEELIGVVLSKSGKKWVTSFAFTSQTNPIAYAVGNNEQDMRFEFERFAKHLQTKAFDKSDPEKIMEFNWNQLSQVTDEHSQITQNLPDIDFDNPPKGIRVEYGRKGFRIELPAKGFRIKYLSMMSAGFFLFAGSILSFFLLSPELLESLIGLSLVGSVGGIIATIAGAAGYFGRERIMMYQGKIHTDFAFMNMPFWTKSMPVDKIEEIIVRGKARNEVESNQSLELYLETENMQIVFGKAQSRKSLEWVRSALIQKLYQGEDAA